jgi:hypothetical protein
MDDAWDQARSLSELARIGGRKESDSKGAGRAAAVLTLHLQSLRNYSHIGLFLVTFHED